MDLKEIKSLFGLKGLPWVGLLGSALGLCLLASWRFGTGHPSEAVLWFLTLLGVDASAQAAAVHGWFVDPVRSDVIAWVCNVTLLLLGVAYARCYWRELESGAELNRAGSSLHATKSSLYRKDSPATGEQRKTLVKQAEKTFSEISRHESDVRAWCVSRMIRLAQVAMILWAILAEAGSLSLGPIAILLYAGFVVVLVGIEVSKAEEGQRWWGPVGVALFLGAGIVAAVVALPVFIFFRLTSPPPRRKASEEDPDDSEET